MIAIRIGSLVAIIAALIGCSATTNKPKDHCANYESPSFLISFFSEEMNDDEAIVDIMEDSRGVFIRVNWSKAQNQIEDPSDYIRLKKRILNSHQWEERVSNSQLINVFCGTPRNILTIRNGDEGICLQGSDVPRSWRHELIRLAKASKRAEIGEQHGVE